MITIDAPQGSDAWHAARRGKVTASLFSVACDQLKKGGLNSKAVTYAANLAMERVCGQTTEMYVTWPMKRGTELEPDARLAYEVETGNASIGGNCICTTDDQLYGYSPDGFVGAAGLIEVKCLVSAQTIISVWDDGDLSDWMHQMQGGLWITDREWCDFIMYAPQLSSVGKSLFVKRVPRDEVFINTMKAQLEIFTHIVEENEAVLRRGVA